MKNLIILAIYICVSTIHPTAYGYILQKDSSHPTQAIYDNGSDKESSNLSQRKLAMVLAGGGIRGLGTLTILADLEAKTGKKIHEMTDLFVGTSTGGIISTLFALGFSATEALDFYL